MYLVHHGIKGQKWGVRRYQNPDGTLTEEGKRHYHKNISRQATQAKVATGLVSGYVGGVVGALGGFAAASVGAIPIAGIGIAGTAAAGAGTAFVANALTTWKDIDFNSGQEHMLIDSGKGFMEARVKIS